MHEEVIVAGFGGQGVMFAAQLLAYAGMKQGKHVAWVPAYGPEQRGGTAHAAVIISDEEIGSLIVTRPTIAIVMNSLSKEKYEPKLKSGGTLVINSSLVKEKVTRADILVIEIPANDLAHEIGNDRLANMIILGALIRATEVIPLEAVISSLPKVLQVRRRHLLEANEQALRRGVAFFEGARSNSTLQFQSHTVRLGTIFECTHHKAKDTNPGGQSADPLPQPERPLSDKPPKGAQS